MEESGNILSHTTNRYYPLPAGPWKYYQHWRGTIMFHWRADPDVIREALPDGIELDTYDGSAWVSVVIFSVDNHRIRNLKLPDFIGSFEEINFRTYVVKDGIKGIYMFSIETDKWLVAVMTRLFVGVPYTTCDIERSRKRVRALDFSNGCSLEIKFKDTEIPTVKSDLDYWLTERHALYIRSLGKWFRHDIHHRTWKMTACEVAIKDIEYHTGRFNTSNAPDRIHFCRSLGVLLWPRKCID